MKLQEILTATSWYFVTTCQVLVVRGMFHAIWHADLQRVTCSLIASFVELACDASVSA